MAETPGSPAQPFLDPESYGEWVASDDDADTATARDEARFLGPAETAPEAAHAGTQASAEPGRMAQSPAPGTEAASGVETVSNVEAAAPAAAYAVPFEGALLSRIAREIRSIRSDLTALKDQFEEAESAPQPAARLLSPGPETFQAPAQAPAPEPVPAASPVPTASPVHAAAAAVVSAAAIAAAAVPAETDPSPVPARELAALLRYLDRLLESLPEEKIEEFARSEYFELYRSVFDKLGLV